MFQCLLEDLKDLKSNGSYLNWRPIIEDIFQFYFNLGMNSISRFVESFSDK